MMRNGFFLCFPLEIAVSTKPTDGFRGGIHTCLRLLLSYHSQHYLMSLYFHTVFLYVYVVQDYRLMLLLLTLVPGLQLRRRRRNEMIRVLNNATAIQGPIADASTLRASR